MKTARTASESHHVMTRHRFLGTLWAGGAAALSTSCASLRSREVVYRKPNIVLVLADDLGYADLGCQGSAYLKTPHIDSLARNGVRFTDAYVSCPMCSPSRAGIMTGRYQQRFGHEFNPGHSSFCADNFGLPLDQITLGDALKREGYRTGYIGKWHLGHRPGCRPEERGFDEFFGFLDGGHTYFGANSDPYNPILRGTAKIDEDEYLTTAFTREAAAYVERHRCSPFFLYVSYNAVHFPWQAPEEYLDRFAHLSDEKQRTYAAMVAALDDGVGAILATLRNHELDQNTLFVFLSDNGGPLGYAHSNSPLSGGKGLLFEGGIRVPCIMQWPGRIPAGTVYSAPVISLDLFSTFVAAAGGRVDSGLGLDGVDLVSYISGHKSGSPHQALYWRHGLDQSVIRKGNWKFGKIGEFKGLADLSVDIGETTNILSQHADIARELERELEGWKAALIDPLWSNYSQVERAARLEPPEEKPQNAQ